jgi:glucokinase
MSTPPLTLGVDIGGTKIAAGLVDSDGKISLMQYAAMPANGSAEEALQAVVDVIENVRYAAKNTSLDIANIGICAPGPLDPHRGIIVNPPNLPCWRDYPLLERIHQKTQMPVKLENDANAAALAEAYWGAGKGYQNIFYASFGTGVGTGYILNGRIFNGSTGLSPEGGHMTIDCNGPLCGCGKRGCIEAIASGSALAHHARETAVSHEKVIAAKVLEMVNGDPLRITAEIIITSAGMNDPFAKQLLEDAVTSVSIWLGNIYDLLEPQVFIFGGGMGSIYFHHADRIQQLLKTWSIQPNASQVPILSAAYGTDSGIAGAAALWQIKDH